MNSEYRPRIISDVMQSQFGKNVTLLGRVASIDPSGKKLCVKDCAEQNVIIFLKQPISDILEIDTWCEVEGKVRGKGAMEADRLDPLPQSMFETFDSELYVQMVKMLIHPGTSNNYVIYEKNEHHGDGDSVELISNPSDASKSELDGLQEESFLNL